MERHAAELAREKGSVLRCQATLESLQREVDEAHAFVELSRADAKRADAALRAECAADRERLGEAQLRLGEAREERDALARQLSALRAQLGAQVAEADRELARVRSAHSTQARELCFGLLHWGCGCAEGQAFWKALLR